MAVADADHQAPTTAPPTSQPSPTTTAATTQSSPADTALMTAADIITDPDLRAVLDAASLAQQQCDALLTLLSTHPVSPPSPTSPTAPASDRLPPGVAADASSAQKQLHAHLARVRALNRGALHTIRATKASTAEARHEVDTLHLALQNLYYEQRHLESEIRACEGYEHPYRRLPLVAEDEFRERYPEVVEGCWREAEERIVAGAGAGAVKGEGEEDGEEGGAEGEDADAMATMDEEKRDEAFEDALMKARIEHEHAERLALEERRQGLLKRKQGLIAENNKRKEDLARLDESLEKFIKAAEPIEQTFQKEY